jgi:hypothetical protein
MFFIFKSNLDQFGRVKSSPLLDGYPPLPEHFIKQYAFLGIYKMGCPKKTTFQHYKMHKVFLMKCQRVQNWKYQNYIVLANLCLFNDIIRLIFESCNKHQYKMPWCQNPPSRRCDARTGTCCFNLRAPIYKRLAVQNGGKYHWTLLFVIYEMHYLCVTAPKTK